MAALARRYGAALSELAVESGDPAAYREQAVIILEALGGKDCREILEHPKVSSAQKKEFVRTVFAGHIGEDLLSFLYLVIDKNRVEFLVGGLENMVARLDEIAGVVNVDVVCARQPSSKQLGEITGLVYKKLGENARIEVSVDPALIGGFYIQAGGCLLDFTVKKQLTQMKEELIVNN